MNNFQQDWERLLIADREYKNAVNQIIDAKYSKGHLLKTKLGSNDEKLVLYLLQFLEPRELIEFADELISRIANSTNSGLYCRGLMRKIPKQWINKSIVRTCEKYINDTDSDSYRRILELYISLDLKEQAVSLCERTLKSNDPEINLVGQDFHQKILDWDGPISTILLTLRSYPS
jgi:hypothetical protein